MRLSVTGEERSGIKYGFGVGQDARLHKLLIERITNDPDVRFGKPCIRGLRITVQEVLEWLSNGATPQQILEDYPQLEQEDFLAIYAYSADLAAARVGSIRD